MSQTPLLGSLLGRETERKRNLSFLLASSSRKKQRRWPLVLRFWKGSVHSEVVSPILLLSLWSAVVVYVNRHMSDDVTLPGSIIPSLSIVVGLELVFRNQTAYSRFWSGRLHFSTLTTSIRCLSRHILCLVPAPAKVNGYFDSPGYASRTGSTYKDLDGEEEAPLSKHHERKTIETIKILIAMLYAVKNHLRADWGVQLSLGVTTTEDGQIIASDYKDLLPHGLRAHEHVGLGLTLQLATYVETYINYGVKHLGFHNAAASVMLSELNQFVSAYGNMEVIRLAPTPVAHLIHSKQVLALFCMILPFAMAANIGWYTIPLVSFIAFTLYGIECIAQWHEDPFGLDKIDINMDEIIEDARREIEVHLVAWQRQGPNSAGIFSPQNGETPMMGREAFA